MRTLSTFLLFFSIYSSVSSAAPVDFKDYVFEETSGWKSLKLKDVTTLRAAFKAPSKKSTFTVREFDNIKEPSLKKNVAKWLSDYKSYGFTVTHKRPLKLNKETYGYLIEALHKKSGKIFKQYMSIKDDKLVTLTCHSDRIDEEFNECGKSLLKFTWKK